MSIENWADAIDNVSNRVRNKIVLPRKPRFSEASLSFELVDFVVSFLMFVLGWDYI